MSSVRAFVNRRWLPVASFAAVLAAGAIYALTAGAATPIPVPDAIVVVTTKSGNVTKTHLVPIGGAPIPIDVDGPTLLGVLEPDIDVSVGLVAIDELPGKPIVPNVVVTRNALAVTLNRPAPPLDFDARDHPARRRRRAAPVRRRCTTASRRRRRAYAADAQREARRPDHGRLRRPAAGEDRQPRLQRPAEAQDLRADARPRREVRAGLRRAARGRSSSPRTRARTASTSSTSTTRRSPTCTSTRRRACATSETTSCSRSTARSSACRSASC